jgi:hypothetical protein
MTTRPTFISNIMYLWLLLKFYMCSETSFHLSCEGIQHSLSTTLCSGGWGYGIRYTV